MQLLQLSSILQKGGQFTTESHGQFTAESVVSFPRNVVVTISGISTQVSQLVASRAHDAHSLDYLKKLYGL